jgi:hypothetical protein
MSSAPARLKVSSRDLLVVIARMHRDQVMTRAQLLVITLCLDFGMPSPISPPTMRRSRRRSPRR